MLKKGIVNVVRLSTSDVSIDSAQSFFSKCYFSSICSISMVDVDSSFLNLGPDSASIESSSCHIRRIT